MKAHEIANILAEERSACLVMTNNGKKRTARLGHYKDFQMRLERVNILAADSILRNYQHQLEVRVTTPSTNPLAPMTIMIATWLRHE